MLQVQARGFTPVLAPMFSVTMRPLQVPAGVQAALATSGNALASLPAMRLLAVGDATAARATAQGFTDVESAAGDAAALAALAGKRLDPAAGKLLLATGAGQGHALAADLRARGFRVVRRVCYATRPARRFPQAGLAAIRSGALHAALFLSAETAACFVRLLQPGDTGMLASVKAVAIGRSTAEALEPLPWLLVCRAATPTLDGVLAQL